MTKQTGFMATTPLSFPIRSSACGRNCPTISGLLQQAVADRFAIARQALARGRWLARLGRSIVHERLQKCPRRFLQLGRLGRGLPELKASAPRITAHERRLGCPCIAAGPGLYARLARLQFETGAAALTAVAEAVR